ncbi:heme oxygenase (biliverdin-producing) [Gordonia zhaorongruii]|uniref:biliverdin-producing heme oxygenase n=1 Tax=Gordonia zhaorongruii TaxID=2597659 RepID=UPI00117EBE28|nr:biliverdin-producing heme oxygenase [Gordonia zhaorongruii]
MTTASSIEISPDDALSVAMKRGSAVEHEDAEGSTFMTALLDGRMSAAGYIAYLQRLRPVYAALESKARELRSDPIAALIVDPALDRLPAIDADLTHWMRITANESLSPPASPATVAYIERIDITSQWAGGFVAHHYTRYLGDLSGGQAIGRILDRTFDLNGAGTDFYKFDAVGKVKPYKDDYRARLDRIGASMPFEGRAQLVDEVKAAFRLNQALFAELSEVFPR